MKKLLKLYYQFETNKHQFYRKKPVFETIISLSFLIITVFAFKHSVLDANNIPSGSMQPTLKIGDFLFVNKMRYDFRFPFTDKIIFNLDQPSRGDIITFQPSLQTSSEFRDKQLVKRLIGIPGDKVQIVDNEIYVNGVKFPVFPLEDNSVIENTDFMAPEILKLFQENIIDPDTKKIIRSHKIFKHRRFDFISFGLANPQRIWIIPDGKYMVMGDHRDNSLDSRSCQMVEGFEERISCEEFERTNISDRKFNPEWGLINRSSIKGKVFVSYFSINFQQQKSGRNYQDDIPHNLFGQVLRFFRFIGELISGEHSNSYIRWERVLKRIY